MTANRRDAAAPARRRQRRTNQRGRHPGTATGRESGTEEGDGTKMSSSIGENLRLTIFGESHSAGIGMTMEGFPAGFRIDRERLNAFMGRRAPGKNAWATPGK